MVGGEQLAARLFMLLREVQMLLGDNAPDCWELSDEVWRQIEGWSIEAGGVPQDIEEMELFDLPAFRMRHLPPGGILIRSSRKGSPPMGILHAG